MKISYVERGSGLGSGEGFSIDGLRFTREAGTSIRLTIKSPEITKEVEFIATQDACRSDDVPSFPGEQYGKDLTRVFRVTLSGTATVSSVGGRFETTLSPLGGQKKFREVRVRLVGADDVREEFVPNFFMNWYSEKYMPPSGGFELDGSVSLIDIGLLADDLRSAGGSLEIDLCIGRFPGFFSEWAFDGWDGGDIKFADLRICEAVLANFDMLPKDFFNPQQPFDTDVRTRGPHQLITLRVVNRRDGSDLT